MSSLADERDDVRVDEPCGKQVQAVVQ